MKNKWLYPIGCIVAPHIMLVTGVIFLAKADIEHKSLGLKICQWSTAVLIIGSFVYYVVFTPIMGID